ncbi:MAG: TMEM175 family protein [Cyclobacteriaceae bacterium]
MIRDGLKRHYIGMNTEFRYRGEDGGRLEAISDSVFALAIALLLISTSAPEKFEDIVKFTYELLPFAFCISLIILIWHEHVIYFLRYGLRNPKIIFLNTIFLFIVLYYVYPLKFLTKMLSLPIMYFFSGNEVFLNDLKAMINGDEVGTLMIIYGIGAASIFLTLAWMYQYARKIGKDLGLDEIELFDTTASLKSNLLMASIPILSVLVILIFRNTTYVGAYGGFVYFLYTPVMMFYFKRSQKKRKKLIAQLPPEETIS